MKANNVVINQHIDNAKKEAILVSNTYTDQRVNALEQMFNHQVDRLESRINKNADWANVGIASVSAMASIPYVNSTTFSIGAGLGNYRNGNAIAVGSQYQLNDHAHLRGAISWNSEDSAVYGVGLALGF